MKHDLSRQHRNQRERRSRKQEDHVTTWILRGMGAGEIEEVQFSTFEFNDDYGNKKRPVGCWKHRGGPNHNGSDEDHVNG